MSPLDFLRWLYGMLMEQGWRLPDIDEMDLFWYLDILAYKTADRETEQRTELTYIDLL
jgi:hypothetical protein